MTVLEGSPVSPGFASGIAIVYGYEVERKLLLPVREIQHSDVQVECDRMDDALEQSKRDLKTAEQIANNDPKLADAAALLSAHAAMASEIAVSVKQQIGCDLVNVEQALDSVIRDWISRLQQLDNEYLRQREQDIRDVGQRMTRALAGTTPWSCDSLPPGSVIVARELLPSEAVGLANSGVVAIVCEDGGKLSHTAIVARALGIPAISGIFSITSRIQSGAMLLVDGLTGVVTIQPTEPEKAAFSVRQLQHERQIASLLSEEMQPCMTLDGVEISLMANVGLPDEVNQVAKHHLTGVGLFRTEFLFIESQSRPSFDSQLHVYGDMASKLIGLPMTIRTFDLGGDKLPPFLALDEIRNRSSLHLRGLRFSLSEKNLLDAQLRAIVQVAQTTDVRILFPMVIGSHDFAQASEAVDRAVRQLDVLRRPSVGAMIETPAALFALDEILALADFVAIGTNDLTQYMLAADRELSQGTDDCTAMHPAVLRAIQQVVEAAEKQQCSVCVCGEEAGDADFACLLVGLGIRELSLGPSRAGAVRHAIRHISQCEARRVADSALRCQSPRQVQQLIGTLRSGKLIATRSADERTCQQDDVGTTTIEAQSRSIAVAAAERKLLRETNIALKHRVVKERELLSGANHNLDAAAEASRIAAAAFDTDDSILVEKRSEADPASIRAARMVQRALFPAAAPCLLGFDIAGAVHPAQQVSGDFFDFISLGPDSVGVIVADVSGHGLGAALLKAQTQAYLHALAENSSDPGELLTNTNRLFGNSDTGHTVTSFLGRLDAATRSFVYAGAGHQGYLVRSNGAAQVLGSTGYPLGVELNAAISSAPAIVLQTGDTLVVPTDGTEESMSPGGREFGQERMLNVVRTNRRMSAAQIVNALFLAARDFADHRPQEDDITALVVKVLPPCRPQNPRDRKQDENG
ncbi:Phosphoenolpyruvate-protein phosphotransferase [Stieleria maiorica]|uniref:Phosphoenolpyruvate-protein phosphotransferase n=2 Tax=Stieleria maiorica TaxID=2795974 RepID=A0A5B9M876_9BACT|nr:Phosphoenolpyruvate-protein phosphotransferase [Stieleria maiorica]